MERLVFPEQGEDWQFLLTFLPPGWRKKARELGAIQRYRKFDNAEALLRTNLTNIPFVVAPGVPFPLLEHLRTLSGTELGDWEVQVPLGDHLIQGRICALKKNKLATGQARRKAMQESHKQGYRVRAVAGEVRGDEQPRTTDEVSKH
jgi:hypothetical protein